MPPKKGRNLSADHRVTAVVQQLSGGYRTVGQMVYQVIKELILTGAFAPGERIRQESIASAIGVSRVPVRSALLQLETEGFVTFHPYQGARVRSLDNAQIDEIYRLRALLETYALRLSMPRMDGERITSLRALAEQLDAEPEGAEFLDLRVRFYRGLYDAERNPMLVQMIEQLRSTVGRYLLSFRFSHRPASKHAELIDRVADGDLPGAEAWIAAHLDGVREGIEAFGAASDNSGDESSPETA
ncbi:GntR family transcriptional regulator [Amycolatopsis sp. FDAARGOS 1241]|uniref:GntR family transcriptional regulator n=1 Tax=Amycolatopsis sp. FDAARGOS 1241 TaxID=2778070 RepID=UPI00195113E8|nr:GntR family transcriptional regulator [Amycolatopsis sp. FDAARGOS 1241]QRP48655.1 GntR family transcriptional regulator [Amycolatopsis sp. FDAARGOS 1241]